ncbi:response regulator [Neorhizobium galegae]|uniref:response regulator n=1 Tax=Neorhizobium galegae TaxID=399 RepID=UPI0006228056|nr:response regulator [Neorhizobium galegae]CDZ54053.1 Response regulator with CheY-like receiver domain and winged-helix DNA-binding domain [Neorhizobium galegae bv. orientalis]
MQHKILIVGDQFLIAMALEEAIVKLGHDVVGIAAGKSQARDFLDVAEIALVDINLLDGASGVAIARELSEKGISVVFMTANPEAVADGVEGALGVTAKPVADGDLAKLLKFVSSHRAGHKPTCPKNLSPFPLET